MVGVQGLRLFGVQTIKELKSPGLTVEAGIVLATEAFGSH